MTLAHSGDLVDKSSEDRVNYCSLVSNDELSLDELVKIVTDTIKELFQEIYQGQTNNKILPGGCTLAGMLVFKHKDNHYAITIQLGNPVLFAITHEFKIIPLADIHTLNNPNEKIRIAEDVLGKNAVNDSFWEMVGAFYNRSKSARKELNPTEKEMDFIPNMLSAKFNALHHGTSAYVDGLMPFDEIFCVMYENQYRYAKFISELIDEFTYKLKAQGPAAAKCMLLLLNLMNYRLHSIVIKNGQTQFDNIDFTRGFGFQDNVNAGAFSCVPDINVYEFDPNNPVLFVAVTSGVSDVKSSKEISKCAEQNLKNGLTDINAFLKQLFYDAYIADIDNSGNMSAVVIKPGKLNKHELTFAYVLDGSGNMDQYSSSSHVVNVVNEKLSGNLQRNILIALAAKNANNNASTAAVITNNFNNNGVISMNDDDFMDDDYTTVYKPS